MSTTVVSSATPTSRPRVAYLDCLRVLATFAVIFDHVANQKWYPVISPDGSTTFPPSWNILNFYESLTHWAVPVFVMISGALFLSRELSTRKIWSKYIARLVTAFLFWTILYAIIDYSRGYPPFVVISNLITGQMHFWYLLMIMGIYAIIPLLRPIARDERLTKYYVYLSLIFSFAAYQLQALLVAFNSQWSQTIRTLNGYFCMNFLGIYTSYFLLGHFLAHRQQSPQVKRRLYLMGIAGFVLTTGLSYWLSYTLGYPHNAFFDNITVNLFMAAVGLFVFARDYFERLPSWIKRTAAALSPYCFGVYLMHPIVIGYLETQNINALWLDPWLATPLVSLLVFVVCISTTWLIRKLPYVGTQIT